MRLFDYLDSGNACTHVAPDGGLMLDGYPAVRAWLTRVAAQPRYLDLFARPA